MSKGLLPGAASGSSRPRSRRAAHRPFPTAFAIPCRAASSCLHARVPLGSGARWYGCPLPEPPQYRGSALADRYSGYTVSCGRPHDRTKRSRPHQPVGGIVRRIRWKKACRRGLQAHPFRMALSCPPAPRPMARTLMISTARASAAVHSSRRSSVRAVRWAGPWDQVLLSRPRRPRFGSQIKGGTLGRWHDLSPVCSIPPTPVGRLVPTGCSRCSRRVCAPGR